MRKYRSSGAVRAGISSMARIGIVVAFAFARTGRASAQSAGSVRANDSNFKISQVSAAQVVNKRAQLRNFVWGGPGFPGTVQPNSITTLCSSPSQCAGRSPVQNLTGLQSVQALRITTTSGTQSVRTIAYHFVPTNRNNRLVIVHQGHSCYLDDGPNSGNGDGGIERTIQALLSAGYSVLGMTMPHYTPANSLLNEPGDCTGAHDSMFNTALPTGSALKFFLQPVAVAVNYLSQVSSFRYADINMLGLSGGGWTTTVYSALDTRITRSFPVAGSVPLYLRVEPYSHDTEQYLPAFYGALSPSAPGLAGYPDLYLLGASGTNRKQIQILNRHDNCCFGESMHNAGVLGISFDAAVRGYESKLKTAVGQVGSGDFRSVIDEVSPVHMISDYAINQVILPTLAGATNLATTLRSVWGGNLCVDIPDNGRPPQAHDQLQIFSCHGQTNQEFLLMSDRSIHSQSGDLCLDVPDNGRPPQNGDRPQLYPCHGGINQKFTFASDGSIRTQLGNLCLDVPLVGRPAQSFDPIQLYGCNGGTNQQFSVNR